MPDDTPACVANALDDVRERLARHTTTPADGYSVLQMFGTDTEDVRTDLARLAAALRDADAPVSPPILLGRDAAALRPGALVVACTTDGVPFADAVPVRRAAGGWVGDTTETPDRRGQVTFRVLYPLDDPALLGDRARAAAPTLDDIATELAGLRASLQRARARGAISADMWTEYDLDRLVGEPVPEVGQSVPNHEAARLLPVGTWVGNDEGDDWGLVVDEDPQHPDAWNRLQDADPLGPPVLWASGRDTGRYTWPLVVLGVPGVDLEPKCTAPHETEGR